MKRIIYFIILVLLLNLRIFSQESEDEIYSLSSHSISFGWSNPISLIQSIVDPNQQEKIGLLVDYQLNYDRQNFYRVHVKL